VGRVIAIREQAKLEEVELVVVKVKREEVELEQAVAKPEEVELDVVTQAQPQLEDAAPDVGRSA